MDSIRFNKLVDRVRVVRLSNRGKDTGAWQPVDMQYPYADVLAIRGSYNITQTNPDRPRAVGERTTHD